MADISNLYVFDPIEIDTITASSVSETYPYGAWNVFTAYVIGDRVAHVASRSFYEAAAASTGVNPSTDTTGKWVRVGANMRYRAFDLRITDPVQTDYFYMSYLIAAPENANCIAFFGIRCDYIQVEINLVGTGVVYFEEISCADNRDIIDAYSYFFGGVAYRTESILQDVPIYTDYRVQIAFYCEGATPEVGEIAFGKNFNIGRLLSGGSAGIVDYSKKERDTFGNVDIIERAYSDSAEFVVQIPSNRVNLVKRTLAALRARPAVYHAGPDYIDFGQTIYGFYKDLNVEISGNTSSTVTLQIEGLS
jgi:hypothetical protein